MSVLTILTELNGSRANPTAVIMPLVDNIVFYTSPGEAKGYNAFGTPDVLFSSAKINAFKKSDNHAAGGDFVIVYSIDGGATTTIHNIKTASGNVHCAQSSFYADKEAGFMYALSLDETNAANTTTFKLIDIYRISISLFEADQNANWTKITSLNVDTFDASLSIGDLWGRAYKNSAGKVRFTVHLRATTAGGSNGRHLIKFIDTPDSGATWTWGATVADQTEGGTFATSVGSEANICDLGSDDVVALWRNENFGYWIFFLSTDGGDTWTRDTVNAFGYSFDNWGGTVSGTAHIPITCLLNNDGFVYSVIGARGYTAPNNHCTIGLLRMSRADFIANTYNPASATAYILVTEPEVYINTTNNDVIHFGYPELYKDLSGNLWFDYYDEHDPSTDWLLGEIKCRVMQRKLILP